MAGVYGSTLRINHVLYMTINESVSLYMYALCSIIINVLDSMMILATPPHAHALYDTETLLKKRSRIVRREKSKRIAYSI